MKKWLLMLMMVILITHDACADTVLLKDGKKLEGDVVSTRGDEIKIFIFLDGEPTNCLLTVRASEVKKVFASDEYHQQSFKPLTLAQQSEQEAINEIRTQEIREWNIRKERENFEIAKLEAEHRANVEAALLIAKESRDESNISINIENELSSGSAAVIKGRHNEPRGKDKR